MRTLEPGRIVPRDFVAASAKDWDVLRRTNRFAMRVASGVLLLVLLTNLVFDILVYVPAGEAYYLYMDLMILPVFVGLFAASSREVSTRFWRVVTPLSLGTLVAWAAVVSGFQGTPYTFFIAVLLVGGVFSIGPVAALAVFIVGPIAFTVTAVVLGRTISTSIALEVAGGAAAGWTISRVLFGARLSAVRARSRLETLIDQQAEEIAKQTEELRTANQALSRQLSEREVLLREIHHRVKNNLQILGSLFRLARENPSQHGVEATMASAENRIEAMALVHQKLYEANGLELVDLSDYLRAIASSVFSRYPTEGGPTLEMRLDRCYAPVDIALNLGLIVTEAVSNAVVHGVGRSERPGTTVTVELSERDGGATIVIRDDGIGMAEDSPRGGLGLMLIEALSAHLGARLSVRRENGTVVECDVDVPRHPAPPGPDAAAE